MIIDDVMKYAFALILLASPAFAEKPVVEKATAMRADMGWQFEVTLRHHDLGWDHYADQWEGIDAAGNVLAVRELMHPHVEEQPFTRKLKNVLVPDGLRTVLIRGRCSLTGAYGAPVELTLSR